MNPLIVLMILSRIAIVEVLSESALSYGTSTTIVEFDLFASELDGKDPPLLLACPAYTPREIEFNGNVSISSSSLFSRKFYSINDVLYRYDVKLNICENPITPAILYNEETGRYEVGYELYCQENRIELVPQPGAKYENYKSAFFWGKLNCTKGPSNFAYYKFKDNDTTIFAINGSTKAWIFHWIPVWSEFVSCRLTRQFFFKDWYTAIEEEYSQSNESCDNYPHLKRKTINDLFSEENQESCFANFSIPSSYGYLTKSYVIPVWYSSKVAHKFTYCSPMNFVPIWKTIAEGHLKKIDLLVFLLINAIRDDSKFDGRFSGYIDIFEVRFGLTRPLQFKLMNFEQRGDFLLSDQTRFYEIPVPRVIYKIIRVKAFDSRSVVIIIHNEPAPISDDDRICSKKSEISGWDKFINEDPKTGFTYICPFTRQVIDRLEVDCKFYNDRPFHLEGYLPAETKKIYEDFENISQL